MIITCPQCNTRYRIRPEHIPEGKRAAGTCKRCGHRFVVALPSQSRQTESASCLPVPISYSHSKIVRVPEEILRKNRLEAFFDDSLVGEQYKILRTQVLQMTREKNLNTLLVTSAGENDGKSLTAANLAISLAKVLEHTVLLVDADLRKPGLHTLFEIDPPGSLSDTLYGKRDFSSLLVNPGINKLTIALSNQSFSNSAEIMGSPAMRNLIEEMKNRYEDRYIIFDAPPVVGGADALILSQHVDGVILVAAYNETQGEAIYKAMDLLKEANVIGTVLNKVPCVKRKAYRS